VSDMNASFIKSAATGFLIGYAVSTLLMKLLTYFGVEYLLSQGVPQDGLARSMQSSLYIQMTAVLLITLPCEVLAGYVGAAGAREKPILAALSTSAMIYAYLSLNYLMFSDLSPPSLRPEWLKFVSYLCPVPACLVGAIIFLRKRDRVAENSLNKSVQPIADATDD